MTAPGDEDPPLVLPDATDSNENDFLAVLGESQFFQNVRGNIQELLDEMEPIIEFSRAMNECQRNLEKAEELFYGLPGVEDEIDLREKTYARAGERADRADYRRERQVDRDYHTAKPMLLFSLRRRKKYGSEDPVAQRRGRSHEGAIRRANGRHNRKFRELAGREEKMTAYADTIYRRELRKIWKKPKNELVVRGIIFYLHASRNAFIEARHLNSDVQPPKLSANLTLFGDLFDGLDDPFSGLKADSYLD